MKALVCIYIYIYINARSVMALNSATRVQILDNAVYNSQSAKTLGKGEHITIPPPCYRLVVGQTGVFKLDMATGLGERKH